MKNKLLTLIILALFFSGCLSATPASDTGDLESHSTNLPINEYTDGNGTGSTSTKYDGGSTTTAGNPTPILNLKKADVFLMSTQETNNFDKIVEGEIISNFDYNNPDLAEDQITEETEENQDITDLSIKYFVMGTESSMVVYLNTPLLDSENIECRLVHYDLETDISTCISTDLDYVNLDVIDRPQFDAIGNVYYLEKTSSIINIVYWDLASGLSQVLNPEYTPFNQWETHANGDVYVITKFKTLLRYSKTDSENLNSKGRVEAFTFLDENHILFQGEGIRRTLYDIKSKLNILNNNSENDEISDGYFIYTLHGSKAGKIEKVYISSMGDVRKIKFDDKGNIHFMSGNKVRAFSARSVINAAVCDDLSFFSFFEGTLYSVGKDNGKNVLKIHDYEHSVHYDIVGTDLLEDKNIEVFKFTVFEGVIYLNGYDMDADILVVATIDVDGEFNVLSDEFENPLSQLESTEPFTNESFKEEPSNRIIPLSSYGTYSFTTHDFNHTQY